MSLLSPCKSVSVGLTEGGRQIEGGLVLFSWTLKAFTPHEFLFFSGRRAVLFCRDGELTGCGRTGVAVVV